jgi:adenine-specific DNA-methyltransferase
MNYIGSKRKLSDFISTTVHEVCGADLQEKVFCDLFAGTGIVGRSFKGKVKQVIANDLEYYSYVLNRNYVGNNKQLEVAVLLEELQQLEGKKGFIARHYGEGGEAGRLYFSKENAEKIDAIRSQIEAWKENNRIDEDHYFFLLATLIESADKVANTASVYGAFLKHIKKSAAKPLEMLPAHFECTPNTHNVYQEDGNALIHKIEGDILYLDPPYNSRQYGANYHLLNTIAKYDTFAPRGKTGLRSYNKSAYSSKTAVVTAFEELIKNAQFKQVFLSYNNEGLMSPEVVKKIMSNYGKYDLATTTYQRFKADKTQNRNHKATSTTEYLHILEK